MNTKKAIEFVKQMTNTFKCIGDYKCSDIDKKQNEIIALLQRGEENKIYKKMWKSFIKEHSFWLIGVMRADMSVKEVMKAWERKYFPKSIKRKEVIK